MTDEFREILEMLRTLPNDVQNRIVKKASRKSAKLIADEAKRRVPVGTGLLKRSIGIRKARQPYTPEDTVRFYVLPLRQVVVRRRVTVGGESRRLTARFRSFHGHLLENGTTNMSARPFMIPAAVAMESRVTRLFQEEMIVGINRMRL